jgi:hypothetical protein
LREEKARLLVGLFISPWGTNEGGRDQLGRRRLEDSAAGKVAAIVAARARYFG